MGIRARVGADLHPLLLAVPLAMCATTVLFDFSALFTHIRFFGELGYVNLAATLIVGVLATAALPAELRAVKFDFTGARRITIPALDELVTAPALHAAMLGLLGLIWSVRLTGGHSLGVAAFLIEILALAAGARAVWLRRAMFDVGEGAGDMAEQNIGERRPTFADEPTVRLWVVQVPARVSALLPQHGPFRAG